MSKFFVTNSYNWYEKLKVNIEATPFDISGDYQVDGFYAISTRKLQVNNVNSYHDSDNLIIQTGTCVYKEKTGLEALKSALSDFDGNVQNHRESYYGNYACVIKKGADIVIFNEGSGFYDIYYYANEGYWLVGSTMIDVARVLADRISVNKLNVLEELTRYSIFDNGSYFNEIKRLTGDQYLSLRDTDLTIKKLDLRIKRDDINDADTRVTNIAKEMRHIAKVMYNNFGQTALGCTGGFDSRMVLASYLSEGIKPKLTYGYGNSNIAESRIEDLEIDKEYSKRYNLELRVAPWNETEPIDKLWDSYIELYGKLVYDGCEDAYNFYSREDEKFVSVGQMSEIYRETDWSKDIPNDRMTLEEYLWKFHAAFANNNLIKSSPQLVNQLLNKWEKLNSEHGVNSKYFNKEELFWVEFAYRYSADTHLVNLINQYKYTHYLMSEIVLLRNNYLNFDLKYNGNFMIQILNEVFPDILNVPFFTHVHKMKYNPKTMLVEELSSNEVKRKIKPFIRSILPSPVKRFINKTFHRSVQGSSYINEVTRILYKDNNNEKLRRLVGDDVFNAIDIDVNHLFVVRGIILCKTLDSLGVNY